MVGPGNVYLKTSIYLVVENTAERTDLGLMYLSVLDVHTFFLASELSSVGVCMKAESLAKSEERTHKQINTPVFHGLRNTNLSRLRIRVCRRAVLKVDLPTRCDLKVQFAISVCASSCNNQGISKRIETPKIRTKDFVAFSGFG